MNDIIVGNVRVQLLSDTLVRIEEKGKREFEDRVTFNVVNREWLGVEAETQTRNTETILATTNYRVVIPNDGASLIGVRVESRGGQLLYQFTGELPPATYLPAPGEIIKAWVMADTPRIVPPAWGATPPPIEFADDPNSDWDVENDAPDIYVFVPGNSGYDQLRRDFLKLTGAIPLPPRYIFGLIDSRYHPYSEETALETIDTYREKKIPLDVFVVDTDWRIGASHGYEINIALFPDMARFIQRAHERNVKLLYNDHPEPVDEGLSPKELLYRWRGLTKLLDLGIDVWWYDRNWMVQIKSPLPSLHRDVWGMRLYHDITQRFHPDRRPLIMSNVARVVNGIREGAPDPAEHRYPIWWTGDTLAQWDYMRRGIADGVEYGARALMPYVNEDLGGHFGDPGAELYVRYVQFGALSPITRLHCTAGETRYPWAFGDEAESIVSEYIRLRYRLLPTIYAAARQAYDDGTPILRRGDLDNGWQKYPEAADNSQFLLGDDILVAPVITGHTDFTTISDNHLRALDGTPGITGEYFANQNCHGKSAHTHTDPAIDFFWGKRSAPAGLSAQAFSIRWHGRLVNVPESGEYIFGVRVSGTARVWLDGKLILNHRNESTELVKIPLVLEKDQTYSLQVQFEKSASWATITLAWLSPSQQTNLPTRAVWIPPGAWHDLWTGETWTGPQTIQVTSELWHTPMYARAGGIILSIPQMQYTNEQPWSTVIIDAFLPDHDGATTRTLYEDDGISPAYQHGAHCRTPITLERKENAVTLMLGAMTGEFDGSLSERAWVLRLHLPKDAKPKDITLNGNATDSNLLAPATTNRIMPFGGLGTPPPSQAGQVLEVNVLSHSTREALIIKIQLHEDRT